MGIPNLFAVFKIKVYVQIHRRVKITVKKLKTDLKLCKNASSASILPSSTHLKKCKATEKEGCHTRRRWQRGNRWWWPWHTATLPQTRTGRTATPGLQECPACLGCPSSALSAHRWRHRWAEVPQLGAPQGGLHSSFQRRKNAIPPLCPWILAIRSTEAISYDKDRWLYRFL